MSDATPPADDFPAPTDSPSTAPPLTGDAERLWASLAHLLSFAAAYVALGFVAPLVVYYVFGNRSRFVRAHAVESLNFQLTALALGLGAAAIGFVSFGLAVPVIIPLAIAYVIFYVIAVALGAIRAHRGDPHRYRLTIRFLKR